MVESGKLEILMNFNDFSQALIFHWLIPSFFCGISFHHHFHVIHTLNLLSSTVSKVGLNFDVICVFLIHHLKGRYEVGNSRILLFQEDSDSYSDSDGVFGDHLWVSVC